jgi:hypothetical protein
VTDLVVALLVVFGVLGIILVFMERLMLAALCVIALVAVLLLSVSGVLTL